MSTKPNPWLALPACRARSGTAEHLLFLTPSNKMLGSADVLQELRGAPGAESMPGALSVPGLRLLPSFTGSQGSQSNCATELTAGLQSPRTSPCALARIAASLHPRGAQSLHTLGLSSLFFPGSLSCFLHPGGFSRPLDHSGLSFRHPSLPWVPLAGASALDPFYSVSLQHPLARSPQFSSTLCQYSEALSVYPSLRGLGLL